MAAAPLGLALIATVALHVEYSRGVDPAELSQLTSEVSTAITRTSSRAVVVDELGAPCAAQDRCVDDIALRTGTEWVVLLRVIGVSSRVRLVLVAGRQGQDETREVKVDLPRARTPPDGALDAVLAGLIPPAPEVELEPPLPPPQGPPQPGLQLSEADLMAPAPEPAVSPWPWLAMGAGVVAGGVGAIFGVRSAQARRAGEASYLPDDEFARLDDQAVNSGIAANVLFGAAAVGVISGVALLIFDEPGSAE